jgi:hypothetical protein
MGDNTNPSGGEQQDAANEEWQFESGDIVREKHAKPSPVPGESEAPKKEYRIKRRLVEPDDGDRFYQVEKEEGGAHLYSDGVLGQYEKISEDESRVWPIKDEVGW